MVSFYPVGGLGGASQATTDIFREGYLNLSDDGAFDDSHDSFVADIATSGASAITIYGVDEGIVGHSVWAGNGTGMCVGNTIGNCTSVTSKFAGSLSTAGGGAT